MKKIEGLIAAPFTPMHANGDINFNLIPDYYTHLKAYGLTGAFINGSTGEGVSLTLEEKKQTTEAWSKAAAANPGLPIINLVGGTCLRDCIDLALFSAKKNIDALAVIAPFYFKPLNVKALAQFISLIVREVPHLPVYFYHIPVLTGVNFHMIDLLKEMDGTTPNFAGIKYTHEDFMDFMTCLRHREGHYDLLWGRDENLLAALSLGAKGGVGSTYNYAAPLYQAIIRDFEAGNLNAAAQKQQMAINMITLLGKYNGIGAGKAFMQYIGLNCGQFREPVAPMSKEKYKQFAADVEALNMGEYFSWFKK